MFIYEKENKLNLTFDHQMPVEKPDLVISKEGETVSVDVSGAAATLPTYPATTEDKTYALKLVDGELSWVEEQG